MAEEFKPGCQRPSIKKNIMSVEETPNNMLVKEEKKSMLKVGKPAPEISTSGFYQGKFMNFNLSDYRGKWVLLCFYPGDFTFV